MLTECTQRQCAPVPWLFCVITSFLPDYTVSVRILYFILNANQKPLMKSDSKEMV